MRSDGLDPGARYLGGGQCEFVLWAPQATGGVSLLIEDRGGIPMHPEENGYYRLVAGEVSPGTRYRYLLNGERARPDPASRFQPEGVHGPSEVIGPEFPWTDGEWINPPLEAYVFYELHTGTFSAQGTFEAIVPRLRSLRDLGVTALELMPVSQFPGERNWGYDGVFPYAVQNSYGGPRGLKTLVNAAHGVGLAVVLDVVYNHLGPEGNYLRDFGPYFTTRYKTPWGDALNFDGPESDEVRRFFIGSALQWVTEFHIDALRLDAIHAIVDTSAQPFLRELALAVNGSREAYVIAESDRNDVHVIQPNGLACDAQWSDDLHHALHALLTGERRGYYEDYGSLADLAVAYREAFVYAGRYSRNRRRRYGSSARGAGGQQFVVCTQNHDQVGNRANGDRLSTLVDFESLKLAAGAVIFSPFLPLLFMGEEYGEMAPFLYFTSHGDPQLVEAIRRGRKEEFADFAWHADVPDPQDEATFLRSRLTPEDRQSPQQQRLREFYCELLRIRRSTPALAHLAMEECEAIPLGEEALTIRRRHSASETLLFLHFGKQAAAVAQPCEGRWRKILHSADACWLGLGDAPLTVEGGCDLVLSPRAFALYEKMQPV